MRVDYFTMRKRDYSKIRSHKLGRITEKVGRKNYSLDGNTNLNGEYTDDFIKRVIHRFAVSLMKDGNPFKKEDIITDKLTELEWELFLTHTM